MTIGIDASRPNEAQRTGTEWYAYHIIQELKKIDQKNRYRLYTPGRLRDDFSNLPPNFENRILKSPTELLWTQLRLSAEMAVRPPDVLFVPAHTIPLVCPRATVLTVHDLGFEYFPELYKQTPVGGRQPVVRWSLEGGARVVTLGRYGNSEYDYHRWAMRYGTRHASHIIAISRFTKNDVVARYGVDPAKISVIGHGFDKSLYRPLNPSDKLPAELLKLRPYILFVGRIEKKKNITRLLGAYQEYREHTKSALKLVLIGKPGYGYEEFTQQVSTFPEPIKKNIHFLGWRSEEEVAAFYRAAELFFFPSLFEGFGIPVIQAMASGVPVVGSNTTALPEVAGGAALLIDPDDTEAMAEALVKVLSNDSLKKDLVAKGLNRAKLFDWRKSAQATWEVLESASAARHNSRQPERQKGVKR